MYTLLAKIIYSVHPRRTHQVTVYMLRNETAEVRDEEFSRPLAEVSNV